MLTQPRHCLLAVVFLIGASGALLRAQEPPDRIDAAPRWNETCRRAYSCLWDDYRGTCRPFCTRRCGRSSCGGCSQRCCGVRNWFLGEDEGSCDCDEPRVTAGARSAAPITTASPARTARRHTPGDRRSYARRDSLVTRALLHETARDASADQQDSDDAGDTDVSQPTDDGADDGVDHGDNDYAEESETEGPTMPRRSRTSTRRSTASRPARVQ